MKDDLWWMEVKGAHKHNEAKGLSIREIKKACSMHQLLRHYAPDSDFTIPSAGSWQAIRCPFHRDTRPSASINPSKDRFRCHTCDVGGDVVDVAGYAEGLGAGEALRWIQENLL